jgi:type IV pilus assembly protein PilM
MNVASPFKAVLDRTLNLTAGTASRPQAHLICDYAASQLTFIEIEHASGEMIIRKLFQTPRPASPEEASKTLPPVLANQGIKLKRVRIAVKGYGVVLRFIQFPKMNTGELKSALTFEAEKFIPFKASEVIIDYSVLDPDIVMTGGGRGMNLLLAAVKHDEVFPVLRILQAAGLEAELVDVNALALMNAVEFLHQDEFAEGIAALEVGRSFSTLAIAKDGKPRFIRDISFGEIDLLKRLRLLAAARQNPSLASLPPPGKKPSGELLDLLREGLKSYLADLQVSFNYYHDQIQSAQPIKKMLIGGSVYSETLAELLTQALAMPVEPIRISGKIKCGAEVPDDVFVQHAPLFPAVLGLALRKS